MLFWVISCVRMCTSFHQILFAEGSLLPERVLAENFMSQQAASCRVHACEFCFLTQGNAFAKMRDNLSEVGVAGSIVHSAVVVGVDWFR